MVRFYLITGFLGAGKTTFLKEFIRQLQPCRLRLIVNEFGREGIDGKLLQNLGAVVDEINNGSIFCSCRLDKFEEALENALKDPPEAIVVEASGLSDPTGIRKILADQERFGQLEFMGSICLADATSFQKVFHTARVCKKQISIADLILLNKTDLASPEQLEETETLIRSQYPDRLLYRTDHGKLLPEWLARMNPADDGEQASAHPKDITLQKALITLSGSLSRLQLEGFIKLFLEDTYRVKGFVTLEGGVWLVDCVGALLKLEPYEGAAGALNQLVALSGQGMSLRKSIQKAVEWYADGVTAIE